MKTQTRAEQWLFEGAEEHKKKKDNEKLQAEFESTDKDSIKKMNDADLARWQSKYPKDSPQTIFAEQLWKYRLARHSAKFAAVIAITSAIIGGIVGYSLRGSQNEVTNKKTETEKRQNENPPPDQKLKQQKEVSPQNMK